MSSELPTSPENPVLLQAMQQVQVPVRSYQIQRSAPYQRPSYHHANKENLTTGRALQNHRIHLQQTIQNQRGAYEQQQQARRKLLMAPQSAPMTASPSQNQQRANIVRQQVHDRRSQGVVPSQMPPGAPTVQRRLSAAQTIMMQRRVAQVAGGGPIRRQSAPQQPMGHQMRQHAPQQRFVQMVPKAEPVSAAPSTCASPEPEPETPSKLPDIVRTFGNYQIRVIRAVDEDMRIYPY